MYLEELQLVDTSLNIEREPIYILCPATEELFPEMFSVSVNKLEQFYRNLFNECIASLIDKKFLGS